MLTVTESDSGVLHQKMGLPSLPAVIVLLKALVIFPPAITVLSLIRLFNPSLAEQLTLSILNRMLGTKLGMYQTNFMYFPQQQHELHNLHLKFLYCMIYIVDKSAVTLDAGFLIVSL